MLSILPALLLLIAGCTSAPLDRGELRHRAERICRSQAAVAPAYAVDSTSVGTINVAFGRCMRSHGLTAD